MICNYFRIRKRLLKRIESLKKEVGNLERQKKEYNDLKLDKEKMLKGILYGEELGDWETNYYLERLALFLPNDDLVLLTKIVKENGFVNEYKKIVDEKKMELIELQDKIIKMRSKLDERKSLHEQKNG